MNSKETELYREIATALDYMVEQTNSGGWSTQHTSAMSELSDSIWAEIGDSPGRVLSLNQIATQLTQWVKETAAGGWSTNNSQKQMALAQKIWAHIGRSS